MRSKAFYLSAIGSMALGLSVSAQGDLANLAKADVNDDLIVDNVDLAIVRAVVGNREGQAWYDARADMDGNRVITTADLSFVQRYLGQRLPSALPLHINEVESNGGVPGDWIELVNAGPEAVDLSNWLVRDNDDTHNYSCRLAHRFPLADTWLSTCSTNSSRALEADMLAFRKPVVLVHGDSHYFRIDKPLLGTSSRRHVENFTRGRDVRRARQPLGPRVGRAR
jgi:hypothetical protein